VCTLGILDERIQVRGKLACDVDRLPVEIRVAGIVRGNGGMSNRRQIRDHERVALICGLTADGGQNFAIP